MLRIAICDDILEELKNIVTLTNQYIFTYGLDAEVTEFNNSDKLMNAIKAENFHLYLLDIVMPLVNGLELGKGIRRLDQEAQIIYATTEPQFALQAYSANPINYLIKPIDKQKLFETLTLAISKIDLSGEQSFTIKTMDSLRVVKLADIVCCEYRNHVVIFSLANGEKVVSRTIREKFSKFSSPILVHKRFLQCHASFVVNMRYVERFAKDSFTLFGGIVVSIAAKQYPVVRDTYMDYLMEKEGK
ncbi:MAG: LytTR family DNA-binding domain-containing protein [Lachnospiraceae bacterium]|nr:LytTR family DNA-binding domain-containing protein [Lachnospiraceae bacterium]